MSNRIKVKLYNKTFKEIDMSDFSVIPEELFANRDDIVEVELPEGVKAISANAFENCQRLEKVVFPSTLESIGEEAFVNCSSLKEADYGKNVRITPTSFTGCRNLGFINSRFFVLKVLKVYAAYYGLYAGNTLLYKVFSFCIMYNT